MLQHCRYVLSYLICCVQSAVFRLTTDECCCFICRLLHQSHALQLFLALQVFTASQYQLQVGWETVVLQKDQLPSVRRYHLQHI